MSQPNPTAPRDTLETEFNKKFKKLKALRNSHQIDEPEFDYRVEQLAADTYAHPTREGWCCACEADIAFAVSYLKDEPELEAYINKQVVAELEELHYIKHFTSWGGNQGNCVPQDEIQDRIKQLRKAK